MKNADFLNRVYLVLSEVSRRGPLTVESTSQAIRSSAIENKILSPEAPEDNPLVKSLLEIYWDPDLANPRTAKHIILLWAMVEEAWEYFKEKDKERAYAEHVNSIS